jgi:hypothetical protein
MMTCPVPSFAMALTLHVRVLAYVASEGTDQDEVRVRRTEQSLVRHVELGEYFSGRKIYEFCGRKAMLGVEAESRNIRWGAMSLSVNSQSPLQTGRLKSQSPAGSGGLARARRPILG